MCVKVYHECLNKFYAVNDIIICFAGQSDFRSPEATQPFPLKPLFLRLGPDCRNIFRLIFKVLRMLLFVASSGSNFASRNLAPLARVERATPGLGNLCSIHLSYRGMPFYCCALLAKSAEAFSLSRVECEGGRATGAMLFYCIRPVCEIPPKHSAYRALNAKADKLQGRAY